MSDDHKTGPAKTAWPWRPIDTRVDSAWASPGIRDLVAWFQEVRRRVGTWNPTLLEDRDRAAALAAGARPELFTRLVQRPIGVSHIADLHARATRNQSAVRALRADGSAEFVPLEHGAFKRVPNNPRRPDGAVHEYCPPRQVGGQMRSLCAGYHHIPDAPVLKAAYLHHRLTQIHPFADGNGRTARLLASTPLVAAGLPPVAFPTHERETHYLPALRSADRGDLAPFVAYLTHRVHVAIVGWHAIDPPTPDSWDALDARQQEYTAMRTYWRGRWGDDLQTEPWQAALREVAAPLAQRTGARVEAGHPEDVADVDDIPVDPQAPGAVIEVASGTASVRLAVVGLGRPWTGAWLVRMSGEPAVLALTRDAVAAAVQALDAPLRTVAHRWLLRSG